MVGIPYEAFNGLAADFAASEYDLALENGGVGGGLVLAASAIGYGGRGVSTCVKDRLVDKEKEKID